MSELHFDGADGTALRGWTNDGQGSPVVLVPGIAGTQDAFPGLVEPHSGLAVHVCYMRGTHGSQRPADESRVRLRDHADDVLALMDHAGLDRAVLVGSGYGVQVVFEVLRTHRDRVHGILAVAGIPELLGVEAPPSLSLHERLLHPVTSRVVEATRSVVPKLARSSRADTAAAMLARSRLFSTRASSAQIAPVLSSYGDVDSAWFHHLIDGAKERCVLTPGEVPVPVTFLVGDDDQLLSSAAVRQDSASLPDARVREVHGGLFLGVEQPDVVLEEVLDLAQRAGLNPMDFLERPPGTAPAGRSEDVQAGDGDV